MTAITWDDATCVAIAERMSKGELLRDIARDYGVTKSTARGRMERYRDRTGAKPVTKSTPTVAPAMPRSEAVTLQGYELPKSLAEPWKRIDLQARRIGVLSDIHLPYHDVPAINAAVAHCRSFACDTILLNGDILDFYQGSRFTRIPTKARIARELEIGKQFLGWLRSQFPQSQVVYKIGNHEERWQTYLAERAPDVFEIVSNAWHEVIGAKEFGVQIVGDHTRIYAGKLLVLHGHELGKGGGTVAPARSLGLRAMESILTGHYHKTDEHTMRTLEDRIIATRTAGCLCDMTPEYARVNRWDHGFATIEIESGGDYHLQLKRIVQGRVL
jgi:predicted phosphodiesterase